MRSNDIASMQAMHSQEGTREVSESKDKLNACAVAYVVARILEGPVLFEGEEPYLFSQRQQSRAGKTPRSRHEMVFQKDGRREKTNRQAYDF